MKMDKEKELPKRKPTRLQAFDYNTTGAYFITICTDKRRQILSRIVGVDGLPRFGHARGLTPHRGVIQDPRAASLPRRPAKRGIVVTRNGCG